MKDKLILRKCKTEDVDSIMALQEQVFSDLGSDSTLLRRNKREMFLFCCKEPNVTLGLYDSQEDNRLVGVCIAVDASGTDEDLSLNMKKHDASGRRSCNLKLVMIRQAYYGLGFQKSIVAFLERMMQIRGYQCICSTVSPDNLYSRNNFESLGYEIDHEEIKYGGLLRFVYFKQLEAIPISKTEMEIINQFETNRDYFVPFLNVKEN